MSSILKPLESRERAVVAFLWILLVVEWIGILVSYKWLETVRKVYASGSMEDIAQIQSSAMLTLIQVIVNLGLYIAVIIAFLMWMRRAYYNLGTRVDLDNTDGWVVGYWFIPILNLYKPYQLMKEMFTKTTDYLQTNSEVFNPKPFGGMLRGWWILWIITGLLGNISMRLPSDAPSDLYLVFQLELIAAILSIPLTILIVIIIKRYSDMAYDMESVVFNKADEDLSDHLTVA
ncbi:MAG: DUF4328 domain-containing protein [Bacteroidota bacterium]